MDPKQRAADAALAYVRSGMVVGLGTGSTADFFLQGLAAALADGRLAGVRGIPTSRQSERRALELHIPLTTLAQCPTADVTIDGADEIDPNLDLIKGLGGALVREKIVAQNSRLLIIIADASKVVDRLGSKAPLPVEVVPFAHEAQVPFFRTLGAVPTLRRSAAGETFVTDNGNYIYDCRFAGGIEKLRTVAAALADRAGVVDTGLFLDMASRVLVAGDGGVEERVRE